MSKIDFVGRVGELAQINEIVGRSDKHVILINGDGGIGKTTLLQEVHRRYTSTQAGPFIVSPVLDFDERALHIAENLERRIARNIGLDHFQMYLNQLLDYHRMKESGLDFGDLASRKEALRQLFIDCLNQLPEGKRLILLFDTTDQIGSEEVWQRLKEIIQDSKRAVFILAGRNGDELARELEFLIDKKCIHPTNLDSLDNEFSQEYIERKEASLNLKLSNQLREVILRLSAGRPILVDLALEWTAHHVPMKWLQELKPEELDNLTDEELQDERTKFEIRLVQDVVNLKKPIDQLILLMSRVYPINPDGLNKLLAVPDQEAARLLEKARELSFVKVLPDEQISLHDEMRRLVTAHVWPKVDGGQERRRHDSKRAILYLTAEIERIGNEIERLGPEEETDLDSFMEGQTKKRQIWALREQLLFHEIFLNPDRGADRFIELFDQATEELNWPVRGRFIELVNQYSDRLTEQQRYKVEIRQATDCAYHQDYQAAIGLAQRILDRGALSPEQEVETLLEKANALVRSGQAEKAILDFKKAIKVGTNALAEMDGKDSQLDELVFQARNGLGWAYRVTGDLEQAEKHYENLLVHLIENNKLGEEYGRLLNNLSFIYSEKDRQQAIEYGQAALDLWETLEDPFWRAKSHCTLGIAYYRSDIGSKALEHFNEAYEIFRQISHREEIGQVLSWRGALYQDMGREFLDLAQADLEESLQYGSENLAAMTLNRLGRVYMSRHDWDRAEETIRKSLKQAKAIPDYVYWLGSIARLTFVAAERRQDPTEALNRLEKEFEAFQKLGKEAEKNSLGMTYLGLARLHLVNGDIEKTLAYLKKGIPLVTEYGTYARSDIITRLTHFEKDFERIDPDTIRRLGTALADFVRGYVTKDRRYLRTLTFVNAWAQGKKAGQ